MKIAARTGNFSGRLFVIALISLLCASCSRETAQVPTAEDRRLAEHAIAPGEVLLLLRGGDKQKNILEEVTRRRLSQAIDPVTENKMREVGATSDFIAALQAKDNVLTARQKIAYDEQQSDRQQQIELDKNNRLQAAATEQATHEEELQRRKYYQQQTLNNIKQREQQQVQYEQADRNYKSQRQSLEQNIQYLEASLNRRRGYGANETDLRADVQTLDRYKDQLRNLTSPLRPL